MGDVYFEGGQYAEAVAWYNKAISLSPEDRNIYYERGQAYEKQGLYREAIRDFHRAIQLAPNDKDTMNEISAVLSLMKLNSESDQVQVLKEEGFNETQIRAVLTFMRR
jgi:tetratricopeptide (TPR) repeat protein